MALWTLSCLFLGWTLTFRSCVIGQCTPLADNSTLNFSVPYHLPSFNTSSPIQNLLVYDMQYSRGQTIYLATRNKIWEVDKDLKKTSTLVTGPVGSPDCQICSKCDINQNKSSSPEDTDNLVLVVDPAVPYLYSCGSSQHGICYLHRLVDRSKLLAEETSCLFKRADNSESNCPDCIASPLGTQVSVVEEGQSSYFYIGASVNSSLSKAYGSKSLSIRRLKGSEDGFVWDYKSMVLPNYLDSYPIDYVYTFKDNDHVYFLTVQKENVKSNVYHSRIGRLNTKQQPVQRYRELILECRFEQKRRRKKRRVVDEDDVVYNVLQAAHVAKAGPKLARELNISPDEDMLFGVFAVGNPESSIPHKKSALCAYRVRIINKGIKEGEDACCSSKYQEELNRGLCFYQECQYCPHNVSTKCMLHTFNTAYYWESPGS
nr:PREDICTED: macrophage-stimulating protein receptor [Latimeria chalumnae]|eukprot:XP_006007699.1 PREDICTED: macrophage-stimulating protein receptor [Latimeria chalumnae]